MTEDALAIEFLDFVKGLKLKGATTTNIGVLGLGLLALFLKECEDGGTGEKGAEWVGDRVVHLLENREVSNALLSRLESIT